MKKIIRNKYLNQLNSVKFNNLIKVIVGIRKSGKSTILNDFIDILKQDVNNNILHYDYNLILNIDSFPTYKELHKDIISRIDNNKKNFILIDEIQECKEFEKVVNEISILKNCDVYITGSNSHLLSNEISTLLSGKNMTIYIQPFVFSEFCEYYKDQYTDVRAIFDNYMTYGGMPGRLVYEWNDTKNILSYLEMVYSDVFKKDIINRYKVKDVSTFNNLFTYILNNPGKKVSIDGIVNYINSNNLEQTNKITIKKYLLHIANAYLSLQIKGKSKRTKKILENNAKYYAQDIGFIQLKALNWHAISWYILENIVLNQLYYLGYQKIYYDDQYDIDFVAYDLQKKIYIQITEELHEHNVDRELNNLKTITDAYKRVVIVKNGVSQITKDGITIINLFDLLLDTNNKYL